MPPYYVGNRASAHPHTSSIHWCGEHEQCEANGKPAVASLDFRPGQHPGWWIAKSKSGPPWVIFRDGEVFRVATGRSDDWMWESPTLEAAKQSCQAFEDATRCGRPAQ
jgi:hypothetical protein